MKENSEVDDFIIQQIDCQNNSLAKLDLLDDSGNIAIAYIKDNVDLFLNTYKVNDKICCKYISKEVDDVKILNIIAITKCVIETIDFDKYKSKFEKIITDIKDSDYKKIIDELFVGDILGDFLMFPAAKRNHHNYKHGLLQHSVDVVEIALYLSNFVTKPNLDLIRIAGLIHDIGKINAYDFDEKDNKIIRNESDDLLGHLSISALFISKIVPKDIDYDKIMLLYHVILSHHGELSYGSPVVPRTKEALLINKADVLSASLNHINNLVPLSSGWTKFDDNTKRTWKI